MNVIERYFGIDGRNTTIKTEILAGLTTFLTMAYIIFVNPDMLAKAGMDKGAVFVVSSLSAGLFFDGIDCAFARGIGTWHGSKCVFYLYRRLGNG